MNAPEGFEKFMLPYDWPCRNITPDPKQMLTSTFMVLNPHSFILNDPGTGKTICSLWASDFIMRRYPGTKTLVIAPLSTLTTTWQQEIATHMMGRRDCTIVHGTMAKRLRELNKDVDYYLINHDGIKLSQIVGVLMQRPDIKVVILDESTSFADGQTVRSKWARKVLSNRPYLWLMTGTPVIRGHLAAHGQARLLHPTYKESFGGFRDRTTQLLGMHKREPTGDAYPEAFKLLKPAIRISRKQMHNIPPSIPVPYDIPFSKEQETLYKQLKKDYIASTEGGGRITAVHEGVLRTKLLQICQGAVYDVNGKPHVVDASPRRKLLGELIADNEDKTIVFAGFTSVLEMLYADFRTKFSCALITGKVGLKARTKIFDAFQREAEPKVIFADPGTMSHGLTLTKATQTIWYGPIDKAETYVQANYRIDRPGKTKDTYTVQFMTSPVEREIFKRLEKNQSMEGAMLAMLERTDR